MIFYFILAKERNWVTSRHDRSAPARLRRRCPSVPCQEGWSWQGDKGASLGQSFSPGLCSWEWSLLQHGEVLHESCFVHQAGRNGDAAARADPGGNWETGQRVFMGMMEMR